MRKTIILAIVLIVISPLLLASCIGREPTAEEMAKGMYELLREYAAFDKAYIPALVFTNQGKVEQSQKAMARLKEVWEPYINKYGSSGLSGVILDDTSFSVTYGIVL